MTWRETAYRTIDIPIGDFVLVEMAGIDTQPSVFQPSVDYLLKWLYHFPNHFPGVL